MIYLERLRTLAASCRHHALATRNAAARSHLLEMAEEYEQRALELAAFTRTEREGRLPARDRAERM